MWNSKEIKQGDSGLVVSNKLDAEFQRIHTEEDRVDALLNKLEYTDKTTINDKSEDRKIVSPYTMWYILDPMISTVQNIKLSTDHFSETEFDSVFWIRTDVLIEYSGAYVNLDKLSDGSFVTLAHLGEFETNIKDETLAADGSTLLPGKYEPVEPQSIATKSYVDSEVASATANIASEVIEFPPSEDGDTLFSYSLGSNSILVYVNGVLQRATKYGRDQFSVTFIKPLSRDDEVTIAKLGDKV